MNGIIRVVLPFTMFPKINDIRAIGDGLIDLCLSIFSSQRFGTFAYDVGYQNE